MSTLKSILKKKPSSHNKTKKRVLINPNFNEIAEDKPEPITDISKHERWTNKTDEKMNREQVRNSRSRFSAARKQAPMLAAKSARRRFNIPSPDPPENRITVSRRGRIDPVVASAPGRHRSAPVPAEVQKTGAVRRMVNSVMGLFGRKGGRKTLKNKRK
uniref:Uncharacterized protein n=1 Tax=viral metagenome TaxID=1070528 RepID=A0A6C0JE86_9ZZZZ